MAKTTINHITSSDNLCNYATIGFDIGGTNIRTCVYNNGNFVELVPPKNIGLKGIGSRSIRLKDKYSYVLDTPSRYLYHRKKQRIPKALEIKNLIADNLTRIILFLIKSYTNLNICNIGIAFAGPVKKEENGLIKCAVNIWGMGSFDLKTALIQRLRYENIIISNITIAVDDEASGYRYLQQREYTQNNEELHYLTVGTGHSGVKIDINTKKMIPYESGHHQVIKDPNHFLYLPCNCGKNGHLEPLVAGSGVEKLVRRLSTQTRYQNKVKNSLLVKKNINKITANDVIESAKEGDTFALEALRISAEYLSQYVILPIIQRAKDKSRLMIIINGGYIRAIGSRLYLQMVKSKLATLINKNPIQNFSINKINESVIIGINDDNDALYGAVFMAEDSYKTISETIAKRGQTYQGC